MNFVLIWAWLCLVKRVLCRSCNFIVVSVETLLHFIEAVCVYKSCCGLYFLQRYWYSPNHSWHNNYLAELLKLNVVLCLQVFIPLGYSVIVDIPSFTPPLTSSLTTSLSLRHSFTTPPPSPPHSLLINFSVLECFEKNSQGI